MTVEARAQRVLYQGNGTAVEFPFDFAVYAANQVRVVTADAFGNETERAHGAEFSVRLGAGGVGGYAGGTVVYPLSGAPLAPGEKIAVLSAVPSTQDKSFPNNTPYFQEQIEGGLDKATRLIQQLEADVARSIKVPPTSAESPEDMGAELLGARDEAVAAAESAGGALVGAEAARDAASGEVDRAAREAARARDEADRAAQAAQLGAGAANLEAVWTLAEAVAAGESLDLPVTYFPGRNMLHLSYDGVELYRGPQYEEIGEPGADARSSAVRMRIPLVRGTVMRAWAVASNVARHVEEAEERAGEQADRAEAEADRAASVVRDAVADAVSRTEDAANRAEAAAGEADTARKVAQNAAQEATEQADRADDAAVDAGRYRAEAMEAAKCAAASAQGRSLAAVQSAELLDRVPSGFFVVNGELVLPGTIQHPLTPVDSVEAIPNMDGFFLLAPPFPDCPDPEPGPDEPDEPGGDDWALTLPCGKRAKFV